MDVASIRSAAGAPRGLEQVEIDHAVEEAAATGQSCAPVNPS
jgi:hypothetical protein